MTRPCDERPIYTREYSAEGTATALTSSTDVMTGAGNSVDALAALVAARLSAVSATNEVALASMWTAPTGSCTCLLYTSDAADD